MNASALLTSQGWLGPGHALDSRLTDYGAQTYKQKGHRGLAYDPSQDQKASQTVSSGNGLIRPLLISQRHGSKHGIGKKAHEPASGNEWWLKGFANALANVGKSESERSSAAGSGPSSGTNTPRNGVTSGSTGKYSGLYSYFTAGQVMKGTLQQTQESELRNSDGTTKKGKKRKSDVLEETNQDENDNRIVNRDPLAVSPVKRPQTAKEFEKSIPYLTERDKGRKVAQERVISTEVEQFTAIGQFLEAVQKSEPTDKIQKKDYGGQNGKEKNRDLVGVSSETQGNRQETKEERRARRKRRKEEKEAKKTGALSLSQMVEEELAKLSSLDNSDRDGAVSGSDGEQGAVERPESRRPKNAKKKSSKR